MTNVKANGCVEFRFFRPGIQEAWVVGDFNGWCTSPLKALPLRPAGDGWWEAVVSFAPGDYRFRYVADGTWYTDYAANGIEPAGDLGLVGANSILVVPPPVSAVGRQPARKVA